MDFDYCKHGETMSKYYKAEDVLAIFSEEERPLNWTDSESEIQAQNDFDCYKGMIESLPTIEVSEDCISTAYLEQEIENQTMTVEKDKEYWRGWNNALGKVVELVEDAPSVVPKAKEGEWIPCSERLPKKSGDYLTTTSFDLGATEPAREVYKNYFCAISQKWLTDDEDVIAWMPLPKPWKGADDDN